MVCRQNFLRLGLVLGVLVVERDWIGVSRVGLDLLCFLLDIFLNCCSNYGGHWLGGRGHWNALKIRGCALC